MARKKTGTNRLDLNLPPAALYREDLERIVGHMAQVSENISIETDEHELDSIEDLANTYDQSIFKLKISAGSTSDPEYLYLTLYDGPQFLLRNSIYGNDAENPKLRGVAEQIADVFEARKPISNRLSGENLFLIATIVSGVVVFDVIELPLAVVWAVIIVYVLIGLNCVGTSLINRLTRKVGTYPYYSRERAPNFFQRKKDDLLTGLIVGIILFALGFIAGRI